MATEFVMPKLGLTMEAGTITEWLVADGAAVAEGDPVLVIETDKVDTEVNAPSAGVLHRTGAVGDTFGCGEVIGWLLAEGESAPTPAAAIPADGTTAPTTGAGADTAAPPPGPAPVAAAVASTNGRLLASPNARRVAAERGVALASVRGTGPGGRIVSEDVDEAAVPPVPAATPDAWGAGSGSTATLATAGARQLADLLGVDLRLVPAGRDGRRQRDDVAAYVREQLARLAEPVAPGPAAAGSTASGAPLLQRPTTMIPLRGMRGVIAQRMHQSLAEMAQLTLHLDASMDAVIADRTARKEAGTPPGYTDYLIAAAARALREHPIVNAQVTEEGIALLPEIHIGMAVALDDGLLVPVIRNADRLDLSSLAAETSRLADAARAKKLPLSDLEGGTFSVSSLGMFGVDGFTPVINAPNVAILGVGRLREELRRVDGELVTATTTTLSLTWDHRVLDGAPAATFAQRIAALLADPAALDATA